MAAVALGLVLSRQKVDESIAKLKQADNFAIILEIILLVAFLVLLGTTAQAILSGVNGILLIGGTVIVGLIIPLVIQFFNKRAHNLTALAAVLVLLGGLAMRTVIVMGGQGLL
jgi:formate-dependent nitrite reductase membrane component NrfD